MPAGQAGHVGSAEHGVTTFMVIYIYIFWSWLLCCRFFTLPVYFHQWTIRPGPVSTLTLILGAVEILNEVGGVVVVVSKQNFFHGR